MDKRTKEYKAYKAKQKKKSKGLGDTIAKATKATGIDKAVKFIANKDCGCDERQEKLNKLFNYDIPECLTETEYDYLKRFFKNIPEVISFDTQKKLLSIYNRIFKKNRKPMTCCVNQIINPLEKVIKEY